MATLKLSRDIPFRPTIPAYQPNLTGLKWASDKEDLVDLDRGLFDKLVKLILSHSVNGRIKNNEISREQLQARATANFIRHGAPEGMVSKDFQPVSTNVVILEADEFTITKDMLDSVDCVLSVASFAKLRNYEDSFLTFADDSRIVISSNPTSESNRQWEKWRLSGTELEQVLIRSRHLEKMRQGTADVKEDKVIFKQYPALITEDNSLNRAGKIREWLKRESAFLSSITKR